jgi:hypothetical protein
MTTDTETEGQTLTRYDCGFHRQLEKISALLEYYAVYDGNSLLKFRNDLSVPSSRIKTLSVAVTIIRILKFMHRKIPLLGPIGCTEASVMNYRHKLRTVPEEEISKT